MKKLITICPALLIAILLSGCQNPAKKAIDSTRADTQTTTATGQNDKKVEWAMLQSLAQSTLKAGDVEHADSILERMLAAAGNDPQRWQAMAQVVAGLPREKARSWLDKLAQAASIHNNPDILLTLSQLATAMGNNNTGLQLIEQSLAMAPDNPKSRFWHARLLEINNNVLQAQAEYQWLIEHYPKENQYKEALANLLTQQDQLEAAEAIYASLPQNRDTVFRRLLLAIKQQDKPRANALFTRLKSQPVDPELPREKQDKQWYLQGEAAWALQLDEDALNAYENVRGGEYYVSSRFRMASLLDARGETDRALEILRRLQNHDSETATRAAINRAALLDQTKRDNEAFAVLNDALRYQPKSTELLYARGLLHERHGDLEAMESDLQSILAMEPDNATALNALGYSLADHNIKLEQARKYLEKALALEPNNPAIIDSMGWLHYRLGNYQQAEKLIRKALSLSGSDPEIYHHLIAVLQARGKTQEASTVAKQARSEFPDFEQ